MSDLPLHDTTRDLLFMAEMRTAEASLNKKLDRAGVELAEAQVSFRVQGSGFRVQGSGFRVQGSGFRVQGAGPGFRVQGSGFGVQRPPSTRSSTARASSSLRPRYYPPPPC